jgi:predicted enzyme involved in methoxymalonyl-ACP biosynthesis
MESFALNCRDRFGDYGLVGFAVVDVSTDLPVLIDFVLSCRVAQKRVEETFLSWYGRRAQRRGATGLRARFAPTDRNAPLREALAAVPFDVTVEQSGAQLLEWTFGDRIEIPDVMQLEESEA